MTRTIGILEHPSPAPVFPNPVDDILTVDLSAISAQRQSSAFDIRLYDMQGNMQRQAMPNSKSGNITFNLSNLPNGVYFLHIYDEISNTPEIHKIYVKH